MYSPAIILHAPSPNRAEAIETLSDGAEAILKHQSISPSTPSGINMYIKARFARKTGEKVVA